MGLSIRVDTTRLSSCQSGNMNTACGDCAASSDKVTTRSLYLYTCGKEITHLLKFSHNEVSISQRSSNAASKVKSYMIPSMH